MTVAECRYRLSTHNRRHSRASYGVSVVRILEKTDRVINGSAPYVYVTERTFALCYHMDFVNKEVHYTLFMVHNDTREASYWFHTQLQMRRPAGLEWKAVTIDALDVEYGGKLTWESHQYYWTTCAEKLRLLAHWVGRFDVCFVSIS